MFEKYPSIPSYRELVKYIRKYWDHPYPIVSFRGTVKLHGTNAGLVFTRDQTTIQSRNREITVESDNQGFAKFISSEGRLDHLRKVFWDDLADDIEKTVVYGEWCGGNIQKGVGINQLPKQFVVFEAIDYLKDGRIIHLSIDDFLGDLDESYNLDIYSVLRAPRYEIEIDFNNPSDYVEKLHGLTLQVEENCPYTESFGKPKGIGEGIVWTGELGDEILRFKTKGTKHSTTRVKGTKVDITPFDKVKPFLDTVLTQRRFEQGFEYLEEMGFPRDKTSTGKYIQWIREDVEKENKDLLDQNIPWKNVVKYLNSEAAKHYQENY